MKISQKQNISEVNASVNKTGQSNVDEPEISNENNNNLGQDNCNFSVKTDKSIPNINILQECKTISNNENETKDKSKQNPKGNPVNNNKIEDNKNSPKLSNMDIGVSYFNDSNMFVKNEDDLGMTTSYHAYSEFSFLNNNGSKTDISINNNSALHSQFLFKDEDVIHQSVLTTNEVEVGIKNNEWLIKNPDISVGAKVQYKGFNTNPHSGWANVQEGMHKFADLRQYENHENPFVKGESYVTPMITIGYEKEQIFKDKLYLKTEANASVGTMIPFQQNSQFYTPLRAEAYSGVKVGYSYKNHPIIYLKADGHISNEPLPYDRDHGTLGSFGVAVGNEFSLIKKDKMNLSLNLESKMIKPFGNLPNNSVPDQAGKHDIIHEMIKIGVKLNF